MKDLTPTSLMARHAEPYLRIAEDLVALSDGLRSGSGRVRVFRLSRHSGA